MGTEKEKELMREVKRLRAKNERQEAKINRLKSELSKKNNKNITITEERRKLLEERLQDTNIVNLLSDLLSD